MQQKLISALVLSLFAVTTAQASVATKHRQARTKERAAAFEQWRNGNACAAPDDIAEPPYSSNLANGAMASGPAGR